MLQGPGNKYVQLDGMNKSFLARSLHKWLGLIVGLQVLIWLATGLYMVVLDLDFIHGDPLVRNMQQAVAVPDSSRVSVAALRAQYPDATEIGLRPVLGTSFFTVTTPENRYLINPQSAQVISPLDEEIRPGKSQSFISMAKLRYVKQG